MTKKIKIAYWFLILTMVLRICGAICVKPVHAHYQNDVYLNTVVQASSPVTSDCLVAEGQTVLLGYVERGMAVTIHFESDSYAYGVLDYYLVDETQEEYLRVFMRDQDIYLSGDTDYVNLYIMPTESAALLETDIDVDIFVSFDTGDQLLYATFRATLPGAVVEEQPEDDGDDGDGDTTEDDRPTEDDEDPTEGGDDTTEGGDGTTEGGEGTTEGGDDTTEGGDDSTEGGDDTMRNAILGVNCRIP